MAAPDGDDGFSRLEKQLKDMQRKAPILPLVLFLLGNLIAFLRG